MGFMDGYIDVPKPTKPAAVDRKSVALGKNDNAEFLKQVNNLLELKKFIPDYEQYLYANQGNDAFSKSLEQFGKLKKNKDGTFTPSFGEVSRSTKNGNPVATDELKDVVGLQINDDDSMIDFDHIAGVSNKTSDPTNSLISSDLWEEVQKNLKNEKESYYELMMKQGLTDKDPQEAFYIMVGMLESRTRVWNTMSKIFGTPGQSEEQHQEAFNAWVSQWNGKLDNGQIGFMKFFLDTQQSFISHIMPMYGGSDSNILSAKDKEMVQDFFETLSEKVSSYIGISDLTAVTDEELAAMPEEKANALRLWNAWLNPDYISSADQNTDPLQETWTQSIIKKMNEDTDALANNNIAANTITSMRKSEYKDKLTEYEERLEEKQQEELQEKKAEAKKIAEQKQLDQKVMVVAQQKSREARGLSTAGKSAPQNNKKPSSANALASKKTVAAITKRLDALRPKTAKTAKAAPAATKKTTPTATVAKSKSVSTASAPKTSAAKSAAPARRISVAAGPAAAPRKAAPKTAAAPKFKSKLTIG